MRPGLLLLAIGPSLFAGNFDGRWAMQSTDSSHRVFWMEVTSLEPIAGNFFGATGGRLERLRDPVIEGKRLRFHVLRSLPKVMEARVELRTARDGIEGSVVIADKMYPVRGWRSPVIADRDDGRWREGVSIRLLETLNLGNSGEWRLEKGVLENTSPKAQLLVSKEQFWNFRLHAEFRLPKDGNAGIGLRHHYELQLADDYGQPPDVHGNASLYSQIAPSVNASRPAGEWQEIEVTLIGRELSVVLNGRSVIVRQQIRGLTGLALDPYEEKPGPIALQGDHGGVAYRNVVVTPLNRE